VSRSKRSSWVSGVLESASEGADRHARLIELLEQNGLAVKPSSRLELVSTRIAQFRGGAITSGSDREHLESLISAYRDFGEVATAAETLLPSDDPDLIKRFQTALKGAALPYTDRHPHARNTQFELFVAALFRFAGYRIEWCEPDLLVYLESGPVGVAVKRLSSAGAFAKRLREGGDQLKRAGRRGIVAMNLDALLPISARFRTADRLQDLVDGAGQAVTEPLNGLERIASEAIRGKPVIALLGAVVIPCVVPSERRIGHVSSVLVRGILSNLEASETAALKALASRLGTLSPRL
jgi:hypothetical protein